MTGGKNGSYWVGHVQNNVSWDFSNSLMFPVNGQCIPPRGPNPAASRPSMNVYTCVMFPFGFQHLRVQIWTNQMASSVLKPAASSVFLPPVLVGWLWVAHPAVKQALGVTWVKVRQREKSWLCVCWGLAQKGSFTLDSLVCQSVCNASTDVIRERFFFQMEMCCQIWVLCVRPEPSREA